MYAESTCGIIKHIEQKINFIFFSIFFWDRKDFRSGIKNEKIIAMSSSGVFDAASRIDSDGSCSLLVSRRCCWQLLPSCFDEFRSSCRASRVQETAWVHSTWFWSYELVAGRKMSFRRQFSHFEYLFVRTALQPSFSALWKALEASFLSNSRYGNFVAVSTLCNFQFAFSFADRSGDADETVKEKRRRKKTMMNNFESFVGRKSGASEDGKANFLLCCLRLAEVCASTFIETVTEL